MNKIKVLNVLKNAAALLQLNNTYEELLQEHPSQDNRSISILMRCLNLCVSDIASNYYDCLDNQIFQVSEGKVQYDSFKKRFFKIVKATQNGVLINHSLFINHIAVPNGTVTIEYAYIPEITALSEVITLPAINEEGLTYGLMAEYAIVSGMFNEAKIWNERFNNFLFSGITANKNIIMPKRRWH